MVVQQYNQFIRKEHPKAPLNLDVQKALKQGQKVRLVLPKALSDKGSTVR